MMVEPSSKQLEELAALIDAGKVAVPAVETLPLADARRAHEKIQGGHVRGKLVLRVKG
jgi:NADPH:quinone reductase-like Zn-dependent oxidoreductase